MKHIILLIFLVATVSLASPGGADPITWGWGFSAGSSFQDSGTNGAFGVKATSSDGYDPSDYVIIQGPKAYFGTYHQNGVDGWTGSTGFYRTDFRAPISLVPGQSQTWIIYVWADPTLGATASSIGFSWTYSGFSPPPEYEFRLCLISKPEGLTGGPSVGTTYSLTQLPGGSVWLPVLRTDNGLEGYVFQFTSTVIPEPSSLLALGAGAFGLLGAALRRRRQAQNIEPIAVE